MTSKELAGLVPFAYKFVAYCPKCSRIHAVTTEPPREGVCRTCKADLKPLFSKGGGYFAVLLVRKQIEAYLSRPKFGSLIWKFAEAKHGKLMGKTHAGVLENGDISLTVAADAAVLSKWSRTNFFPIFLFFNNIPVSYQVAYPILAALFCGPERFQPPRHLFFKYLVEELRGLEATPILWKDDLGETHKSFA